MKDPYQEGLIKTTHSGEKVDVAGEIVLVLDTQVDGRGLQLIAPHTRALRKNEIHEFILTDEEGASPGSRVDRINGIGFVEVIRGGIVLVGEQVFIGGKTVGEVAGFDESHMPNHMNVVVKAKERAHGVKLGLHAGDQVFVRRRGVHKNG